MILYNHFLKEALKVSLLTLIGLIVLLLTMRFANYLGDAASGKVAPEYVTKIVMIKMLVSLKDLIPISLFLGTFTAMTRLQQNSEWVCMRAAGISSASMIRRLMVASTGASIVVALITFTLSPQAELNLIQLKEDGKNNASIAGIKAKNFTRLSGGAKIFYAQSESEDATYLKNTYVHNDKSSDDAIMSANRAYISTDAEGRKTVVFENGTSYSGKPGTLNYVITDFSSHKSRIKDKEKKTYASYASFVPTLDLLKGNHFYTTELHWRLAPVISTLLTPMLALMIAMRLQGDKWYLSLIIGLSVFFMYQNCLGIARSLLKSNDVHIIFGLWPVHLIFLLCLLGLYKHLQRGYLLKLGKLSV